MSHNRPPLPAIVFVALLLLGTLGYVAWQQFQPKGPVTLTASGTVEARQVSLAPEIAGKALEVLAEEGDSVAAGDVLLRLDPSLLQAQRAASAAAVDTAKAAVSTAQAALAAAQAQSNLALHAALVEESALRAADWNQAAPTEFDQPAWYFTRAEQSSAAQAEITAAQAALKKAEQRLADYQKQISNANFIALEQDLAAARAAFEAAQQTLNTASNADQDLRDAAQTALDDAKSTLTDAQKAYDDALTTTAAADLLQARAELRAAQERLGRAEDRWRALQTGPNSLKVAAAQAAVNQAQAALEQSQAAVRQAEANLNLLDTQLTKLTLAAPTNGVLLTRSVEPGEVVNPGSVVFTLADLTNLTLKVYIPEDRYAEVSLGQTVSVTVDSFPGETFSATVVQISDQAEFTPRNVQTVEGRKTTVFAILLRLDDPAGKLKPGMPADVVFK